MTSIHRWGRRSHSSMARSRIMNFCRTQDVSPYTGKTHEFVHLDSRDWVNIVAVTEAQQVVMVRQFRHGDQSITLEIPGGMVDALESPETAAQRECQEETGFVVKNTRAFGVLSPNPAIFNNRLHCFVAEVDAVFAGDKHVSNTEKTEVELVPIEALAQRMLNGDINHALVCATLWRFLALQQQKL